SLQSHRAIRDAVVAQADAHSNSAWNRARLPANLSRDEKCPFLFSSYQAAMILCFEKLSLRSRAQFHIIPIFFGIHDPFQCTAALHDNAAMKTLWVQILQPAIFRVPMSAKI